MPAFPLKLDHVLATPTILTAYAPVGAVKPLSVEASKRERLVWVALAVLLGVYLCLAWVARMPGIWTGQDDLQYLLLSQSLRALEYREMFRVDTPVPVMYPPGYPGLLAVWTALGGGAGHFDWLVAWSMIATAGAIAMVFVLVKREWGSAAAVICLVPLVVNQSLIKWGGMIASEASYALLSIAAICILARTHPSRKALIAGGAIAILAALTRSVGVTVLLGIGAYWLFAKRFRVLAVLTLASAVTVGAWQLWTMLAPEKLHNRSYMGDFAKGAELAQQTGFVDMVLERLYWNVPFYLGAELYSHFPLPTVPGTGIDNYIGTVLLGVGLVAGLAVLYQRWRVAFWYLLAYAALLTVWPFRLGRFVVPTLPLLIPAFLLGMGAIAARFRPSWRLPVMGVFALVIAASGAAQTRTLLDQRSPCERWGRGYPRPGCLHPDQSSFFTATQFIKHRLPTDAVVMSAKGTILYYYSGRRVGPREQAFAQDSASYLPFLRSYGVEHLLLGSLFPSERNQLATLTEANCGAFTLEAVFPPRTYLFRLRESPVPRESSNACRALADYNESNAGRRLNPEEF